MRRGSTTAAHWKTSSNWLIMSLSISHRGFQLCPLLWRKEKSHGVQASSLLGLERLNGAFPDSWKDNSLR